MSLAAVPSGGGSGGASRTGLDKVFAAKLQVEFLNDGPVTIVLDT